MEYTSKGTETKTQQGEFDHWIEHEELLASNTQTHQIEIIGTHFYVVDRCNDCCGPEDGSSRYASDWTGCTGPLGQEGRCASVFGWKVAHALIVKTQQFYAIHQFTS